MADRRTTLEQILVEYGGGETRRVTQEQILVEYGGGETRRVTLAQVLVEWVQLETFAVSQFGVYVEYHVPDEETGTQIRGWDQIQPGSVMPDRFSPDVAGDGLAGGGEAGPLYVDIRDPIFWPPTAQGQAVVSDGSTPPAWTPSLTPAWLGQHTFSAGLAVAAAQAITMGDEAYIGCGPADVRIIFDAGNDISVLGGSVGINTTGSDRRLDVLDASGPQLRLTHTDGTHFVDFQVDGNHDLTITPSSTGQIILQPTTDSTDFFQVLDADGGTPILTVDATFERVSVGAPPAVDARFDVVSSSLQIKAKGTAVNTGGFLCAENSDGAVFATFYGGQSAHLLPTIWWDDNSTAFRFGTATSNVGVNESIKMVILSTGLVGINDAVPDRLLHVNVADAATNAVAYAQRLSHVTTNTAVAGFGTGIEFELEENDLSNKVAAIIEAKWSDAGEGANADAYFDFLTMLNDGAAASRMVVGYNGFVGVGIGTPAYMLDVYHATDDLVANFKSNDDLAGVIIADNDSTSYALAKDGYMSLGGQNTLHVGNLNIAIATGYTGIGTVGPGYPLEINSAGETLLGLVSSDDLARVYLSDDDTAIYLVAKDGYASLGGNNTLHAGNLNIATATGYTGVGTVVPDRLLHAEVADSATNAVTYAQRLSHITDDTVIAGFGTGLEFELEENDLSNKVAAVLEVKWSDAGEGANADAYFDFKTMRDDTPVESRMVVGYNGFVGIATTTPVVDLDVNQTIRVLINGEQIPATGTGLEIKFVAGVGGQLISYARPAGGWQPILLRASNLQFNDGTGEIMRITGGDVGVGTTVPFGPFHVTESPGSGMFTTADDVDNVATTIIPNAAGDVTSGLTVLYRVLESAGGVSGGSATVNNNSSVVLYDDGVDVLTLAVAADGSATLQRTAGAASFDVSMWMAWL